MGASDTLPAIQVSYSSSLSVAPDITRHQFGDGYSQRIGKGLNGKPHKWAIQYVNRSNAEYKELFDFFDSMGGTDFFLWTPPPYDTETERKFICPTWGRTPNSGLTNNLSANFEEVFDV